MPDPATTARSAREALARGLNALQAENVPPALVELAAPIAEAMGALHQIERSRGQVLLPHAEVAFTNTRSALSLLQAQAQSHPAVVAATEAVASSLGLLHSLAKLAKSGAPPQQPAGGQTAYQPPVQQAQPQGFAPTQPQPAQPPRQSAQQPYGQGFPPVQPAAQPYEQPAPARQPFKQGGAGPTSGSPLAATFATPGASANKTSQRPPAPPMPAGDIPIVTADLGTHSPSNFYKGLSGNDIIDHGGLFVSTYMLPKIGTQVRLKISLPGGYEFEANGIVRWCREASDGGGGAPPGFGAQLTGITQEARQLVYRYARNREPLFHDDL